MDDRNGLTRRQVIWLLDRQVEGVERAISDTIAATPQPKPSDSQARRILEGAAGLNAFSLAAVKVATKLMTQDVAEAIERAMGYAKSSMHPMDAVPPHDAIPHPDLGGLRLWEGEQPQEEGTVEIKQVGPVLTAAFSLPGRDRILLSRASGIDQTTLSRMTRGSCKGATRSNLRILAHVLGLSPRVLGLDGPANVDPPTARPDLRYAGPFAGPNGTIQAETTGMLRSAGSYVLPAKTPHATLEVLELTDPIREDTDRVEVPGPNLTESQAVEVDDEPTRNSREPAMPVRHEGHVRRIRASDAQGLTAGVFFGVDPGAGSRFTVLGRMTTGRLEAIAAALDMPIEGVAPDEGHPEIVDVDYVGDDEVAARAYAALIACAPAKHRRGLFGS